jgi:hypothetical protein
MVGQAIEMLIPERFRERHVAHRSSYMKDPKARPMGTDLDLWAQRADGSKFPVDIILSPIEDAAEQRTQRNRIGDRLPSRNGPNRGWARKTYATADSALLDLDAFLFLLRLPRLR